MPSRYGEDDASGLSLAANLNLDLKWLHNTAWVYWQACDGGGWGLLYCDEEAAGGAVLGGPNIKYYVLAHYSRHFRPGMIIVATTGDDTVAAYDSTAHRLVVVSVMYSDPRWVSIDLSACVGGASAVASLPVARWVTNTDGGEDLYAQYNDLAVSDAGSFSVYFEKNTIMTFAIDEVFLF